MSFTGIVVLVPVGVGRSLSPMGGDPGCRDFPSFSLVFAKISQGFGAVDLSAKGNNNIDGSNRLAPDDCFGIFAGIRPLLNRLALHACATWLGSPLAGSAPGLRKG